MTEVLPPDHNTLTLGAAKGMALGDAFGDSSVQALQEVLGKKFEVSTTGLRLTTGLVAPTQEELIVAVNSLSRISNQSRLLQATISFALGDLLLEGEAIYGEDFNQIVEQTTSISGNTKHTTTEAMRISREVPEHERIEGLYKTHYQEIINYRKGVSAEDMERIMGEVFSEGKVTEVMDREGNVISSSVEPISCSKLREKLRAASGKTTEKPAKSTEGYFYYERSTGLGYRSQELSMHAVEDDDVIVWNLQSGEELDEYGQPVAGMEVKPLSEKWL